MNRNYPPLQPSPVLSRAVHAQLSCAQWRPAPAALEGAYRVARASGDELLTRLLAGREDTPPAILAELTTHAEPLVRAAAITNPGTPPDTARTAAARETKYAALELIAAAREPGLLDIVAEGVARELATGPDGWRGAEGERRVAYATGGLWEGLARILWANEALPGDAGQKIVATLVDALQAEHDERGTITVSAPKESSLLYDAAKWLRTHPDRALRLARSRTQPWLLLTATSGPDVPPEDMDRAITHGIAAGLQIVAGPRGLGRIPDSVRGWIRAHDIADRLTDQQRDRLRGMILATGAQLAGDQWLAPFCYPPDPSAADDTPALFATGPLEQVIDFVITSKQKGSRDALAAFLSRRDVDTDTALQIAREHLNTSLEQAWIRAQRPWDTPLAVRLVAAVPGHWEHEEDLDVLLAAIADRVVQDSSVTVPDPILAQLGPRILELPWPALAAIGTSKYSGPLLAELLADPYKLAVFTQLSETHTGTLPKLVAAVRAAMTPAGR